MTRTAPQTTSATDSLALKAEQIKTTNKSLKELQQLLDDALDAFARDHSQLTQMATYWGNQPLWWRIGLGVTIIVPSLLISILMQFAVLLTISLFVSAIYIVGDNLLTSHHQQASLNTQKFKDIVKDLNTLQTSIIELTHELHEQLKQEIEKIHTENTKLSENVSRLEEERTTLSLTINRLKTTEEQQLKLVHDLETQAAQLIAASALHSDLYEQINAQLESVRKEYEHTKIQLTEQIMRIGQVESEMGAERVKHQTTIQILKKTLSNFTGMMTLSEEQRAVFEKKITDFIENNQQRFESLNAVLTQTTTHISATTERYTEATNEFHNLLNQQRQLFNKLDSVVERFDEPETPPRPTLQHTASQTGLGLFSEKAPIVSVSNEGLAQVPEIKVF